MFSDTCGAGREPARRLVKAGGAEGNRTPDLCSAIAALSHLSYSPAPQPDVGPALARPLRERLPSRDFSPLQIAGLASLSPCRFGGPSGPIKRNGAGRRLVLIL